ncbi:2'-5' RNA ligase family protein [Luteimonas suaedae]|uniref:2'-5' RNA ligase family protein n=1 Tax=Luteimonas suaedae TaxID=2605430 RepID=UPI0011EC5567|nr:2'-5' RNA ligase family protein [Luteimonas suaedae]
MSIFVAWMPDEDALDALAALCASIADRLPPAGRLKWRNRRQLHMTLRFLHGGLPPDPGPLYAMLADIASRTRRIEVVFDRIETWPRVLVARPAPDPILDRLFTDIEAVARACGEAPERRAAAPHVTLAYPEQRAATLPASLDTGPGSLPPLPFATCLGRIAVAHTVPGGYDTPHWWPLQDAAPPGDPLA